MGKVRISRNLFVVILGVFIWLISAMIASAAENPETTITIQGAEENRVFTCTCQELTNEELVVEEDEGQGMQDQELENQDDQEIIQPVEEEELEGTEEPEAVEEEGVETQGRLHILRLRKRMITRMKDKICRTKYRKIIM